MALALEKAKRPARSLNKKIRFEYQCAICENYYVRTKVEVDHIVPCGSLKSYQDVAIFIERLTPEDVSAFQVLCKECHLKKTNEERSSK